MDWTGLGVIVALLALFASIVFFALQTRQTRIAERFESRQRLLVQVVDAFERSMRFRMTSPLGAISQRSEVEFALALPRLLVELRPEERPVAHWVMHQIRLMQQTVRSKESTSIEANVAMKLTEWHHGEVDVSWFSEDLGVEATNDQWTLPTNVKWKRLGMRTLETSKWTALTAFAVLASASMLRAFLKPAER